MYQAVRKCQITVSAKKFFFANGRIIQNMQFDLGNIQSDYSVNPLPDNNISD